MMKGMVAMKARKIARKGLGYHVPLFLKAFLAMLFKLIRTQC